MNRTFLPGSLLVMAVGLAGCGSSSSGTDRATTVTPKSPSTSTSTVARAPKSSGKTLTEAQMKSALITVADVPTGYKSVPVTADKKRTTSGPGDCGARYDELSAKQGQDGGPTAQEADFQGPGLGTLLAEAVDSFKSEEALKTKTDKFLKVVNDCPSLTSTDSDGRKTELTLSALSFPKLGDQTVALGISGKTSSFTVQLNIVFVRVGLSSAVFEQGGLATDAVALEAAARAGVRKLQTVSS